MDHKYDDNTLTITVDAEEQRALQAEREENPDVFGSDDYMHEWLEPLVCNSELQWINVEDTGDLTDAPILGILGDETTENSGPYGAVHVGRWGNPAQNQYQPIINRWGYMSYQVRSVLDDLADKGEAVFIANN